MFEVTTSVKKMLALKGKNKIIQGATSSGKTYGIIPILYDKALETPNTLITIVAETIPSLKDGCVKIFQDFMFEEGRWREECWLGNPMQYTLPNRSKLQFKSFDSEGKAKASGKREILFINEANHVPFGIADALMIRTTREVWIDFNADSEFWAHTELMKEPNTDFLKLTYLDNESIPSGTLEKMLTRKAKAEEEDRQGMRGYWWNWWQVYGLGEVGRLQGVVFNNWSIIDSVPKDAKRVGYGVDFGYSCFVADTNITTINGQKKIKEIREGDLVRTENGFNRVMKLHDNGVKSIVEKELEFDFGYTRIKCTLDHLFKTKKGWKQLRDIQEGDQLCLNANTMEVFTEDTRTENILNTTSTVKQSHGFIAMFGRIIMGLFLRARLYITLTRTQRIMTFQILCLLLARNTLRYIVSLMVVLEQILSQKRTGAIGGKWRWTTSKAKSVNVNHVALTLSQLIRTNVSAIKNVIISGSTRAMSAMRHTFVLLVVNLSKEINTLSKRRAQVIVPTTYLPLIGLRTIRKEKARVFDLTVENEHNYFANGILVHNCDPTTTVIGYEYNGQRIYDEVIYQTGLSNSDHASLIKSNGISKRDIGYADSADPKSIDELCKHGLTVKPVTKGADSIMYGIGLMQEKPFLITKRSTNLKKELENYTWAKDKDGNEMNKPIDAFNHLVDAARYLEMMLKISKPKKIRARTFG